MKDKKRILCHTCSNVDWVLLVGNGVKISEECYFSLNFAKFGKATECEEYQKNEERDDY